MKTTLFVYQGKEYALKLDLRSVIKAETKEGRGVLAKIRDDLQNEMPDLTRMGVVIWACLSYAGEDNLSFEDFCENADIGMLKSIKVIGDLFSASALTDKQKEKVKN